MHASRVLHISRDIRERTHYYAIEQSVATIRIDLALASPSIDVPETTRAQCLARIQIPPGLRAQLLATVPVRGIQMKRRVKLRQSASCIYHNHHISPGPAQHFAWPEYTRKTCEQSICGRSARTRRRPACHTHNTTKNKTQGTHARHPARTRAQSALGITRECCRCRGCSCCCPVPCARFGPPGAAQRAILACARRWRWHTLVWQPLPPLVGVTQQSRIGFAFLSLPRFAANVLIVSLHALSCACRTCVWCVRTFAEVSSVHGGARHHTPKSQPALARTHVRAHARTHASGET